MRRSFGVAVGGALLIAIAGAAVWLGATPKEMAERRPAERPELLLLTSLPIVFPEQFSLHAGGSPVLAALQRRYRVVPISVADAASLNGHKLLLMAQPRAQPGEVLVELDAWVRSGGRVLLLADPALQWPSERPLGDPLRPPLAYADTGLLGHWGLKLDPPGELTATAGSCSVSRNRLIGRCAIGKGRVTVIADANFLNRARSPDLTLLLSELDRLDD